MGRLTDLWTTCVLVFCCFCVWHLSTGTDEHVRSASNAVPTSEQPWALVLWVWRLQCQLFAENCTDRFQSFFAHLCSLNFGRLTDYYRASWAATKAFWWLEAGADLYRLSSLHFAVLWCLVLSCDVLCILRRAVAVKFEKLRCCAPDEVCDWSTGRKRWSPAKQSEGP